MINASLLGRLGADPEHVTTRTGNTMIRVRVATNSLMQGEKHTTWVNATLFGKRGEAFAKHHRKGDQVYLAGTLVLREYTTKTGTQGASLDLTVNEWAFAKVSDGGEQVARQPADDFSDVPF